MAGFLFKLETPNGAPAEPSSFRSAVPNWAPGETIHFGRRTVRVVASYPSHAKKQEMIASAPPISAIGDGSSRRDLAIRAEPFRPAQLPQELETG
jgi:hypothetical protein